MNIRKKPLRRLKSGIGGHGDLPGEIMDGFKEPDTWTIITALDRILDMAQDSQLSDEFWESVKNPLAFLNKELGLTNVQIVALAMLIEAGEPMSWKSMGNYLGCSRLSIMVYSEEIEELKNQGYDKVLKKVWTCFRPVLGMPCGHCFACQSAIYEGAGELIPIVGYMLGSIQLFFNNILTHAKNVLKRVLPQGVYNVLRGILR